MTLWSVLFKPCVSEVPWGQVGDLGVGQVFLPAAAHLWASFSTAQNLGFLIRELGSDSGTSPVACRRGWGVT